MEILGEVGDFCDKFLTARILGWQLPELASLPRRHLGWGGTDALKRLAFPPCFHCAAV